MKKGQTGAIVLIIIALVIAAVFFFPQFFKQQPTTTLNYKNDVITLEDYSVSNLKPVKNSIVSIKFDVINNGDKDVKNLVIDFSEYTRGGLRLLTDADQTKCEVIDTATDHPDVSRAICAYDSLPSFDSRAITIVFQVIEEANLNAQITVSYDYSGSREALIPIIDGTTLERPPVQFKQSQPSVGPIVLDITMPTRAWSVGTEPFEVKFKFRHVGSSAVGKLDQNFAIEKEKFLVKLVGLEARTKKEVLREFELHLYKIFRTYETELPCDLAFGKSDKGEPALVNPVDIKLSKGVFEDLVCNLQSDTIPQGYKTAVIQAEFPYTYKFTKSQPIAVQTLK